jgi:methyltransferase (TIGR00027 family)
MMLAQRFLEILPQLGPMVAARTRDIDDLVGRQLHNGLRQVVIVGAGLDMRPYRLLGEQRHVRVFELDLPPMLEERLHTLQHVGGLPQVHRTTVPFNLHTQDIDAALCSAENFDPQLPTIFVCEGVSMYQDEKTLDRLLAGVRRCLLHRESLLWMDLVHRQVMDGTTGFESGDRFLEGMQSLGEPFTFGIDDPTPLFGRAGLTLRQKVSSAFHHADSIDPIFSFYDFWHVGPG